MKPWVEPFRITLECLSYVAVVSGVFFFFIQQSDAKRTRSIENALAFVALENDSNYVDARTALAAPWQKVDMSEVMAANPSKEMLAQLKLSVTRDVPDPTVEKVAEFYSSVAGCRESGVCDSTLIDQFFKRNINLFYCAYDERLKQIGKRLNRDDYAVEMQRYAGSCG
jgi:hypothetical protein